MEEQINSIVSRIGLNSFQLKMIAVISMLIDHTGAVLFPQHLFLRYIGRLAFPIYCFLLVEGFFHTRDIRKYMMRLAAFALISEIPFNLMVSGQLFDWNRQNVFFTLLLGIGMLSLIQLQTSRFFQAALVLLFMLFAEQLHTDYNSMGILMIVGFYLLRNRRLWNVGFNAFINIVLMGGIQSYAAAAAIPIGLYNREQGPKMKYFFYLFYPVHLLILVMVKYLLGI